MLRLAGIIGLLHLIIFLLLRSSRYLVSKINDGKVKEDELVCPFAVTVPPLFYSIFLGSFEL